MSIITWWENAAHQQANSKHSQSSLGQFFCGWGRGLKFTSKLANGDTVRFISLQARFAPDHCCWIYKPREGKGVLSVDAPDSRIIKEEEL